MSATTGGSGLTRILGATVIAGIAGYLIMWFVPRAVGPAAFTGFVVFWSALYLVIGALSGIQQEVTRSSRVRSKTTDPNTHRVQRFAVFASATVFVAVLASAPLWLDSVFPDAGWALAVPLAVGTASYVLLATLLGALFGVRAWRSLALLIVADPVLRVAALLGTLAFTHDIVALAWATVLPVIAAPALLWPLIRGEIRGRSQLDVGFGRLSWNVSRTVVASASAAALVSGYPLLLSLTATGYAPDRLGSIFLTITLTRAPLIVTVMALQGYLIVRFRDHSLQFWSTFRRLMLVLLVSTVLLCGLGYALGPAVFGALFPRQIVLSAVFFAIVVGSSALVAALAICASATLARSQHFAYSAGWLIAAVATVLCLIAPLDLMTRTQLSLVVGPACGLLSYAVVLARPARDLSATSGSGGQQA